MSSLWLQEWAMAGFQALWYRLPVWSSWASCVSAKEGPSQQTRGVWGGLLYSRSQIHKLSPGLTLPQPGNPTRSPKTSPHFGLAGSGGNRKLWPSLDLLSEDHHEWLNRWFRKDVRFYRCLSKACLLSSFCLLTSKICNSITALELFNYVEHIFLSSNDTLHWHFTIYLNTRLVVVVFPRLRGVAFVSCVVQATLWTDCRGQVRRTSQK